MNDTGKALCISEPWLCSLLGNKINLDAWDMWDAYTELAANSILNTIYNLVQHKYLQISSSEHSYKLLPVTIFRKTEFHLQLIQYPHISSTTGYFKQILLRQLTKNKKLHFGKTIEYALRNIFPQQKVKDSICLPILLHLHSGEANYWLTETRKKSFCGIFYSPMYGEMKIIIE